MSFANPQPYHSKIIGNNHRIISIDYLRGLAMMVMALDHSREYLFFFALNRDALDLESANPVIFLTRWISHFAIPVFVFLAGTSAYLQGTHISKGRLSSILFTRGLWLIITDLLIITFIRTLDIDFPILMLSVLWAIGISMIILSAAIWLPYKIILAIGLVIFFGHNFLDQFEYSRIGHLPTWYNLLHRPSTILTGKDIIIANLHPVLPWIGLILLGYCFGRIYSTGIDSKWRKKTIARIGISLILLFIILRAFNFYGDPLCWNYERYSFYTFLSFINTTRYPPSLLFVSMTLGPAMLILAFSGNARSFFVRIIATYGRVPFFFYVFHLLIIRMISVGYAIVVRGHSFDEGLKGAPGVPFKFLFPGEGLQKWEIYGIWIVVMVIMYPLCRWFGNFKSRQNNRLWKYV